MKKATSFLLIGGMLAVVALCSGERVSAATLCVNPGGTSGCYPTISKAVAAASANDVIVVEPGEYDESVTIGKPLSLIGASGNTSVINATNQGIGVYVDGRDNSGLTSVIVSGLTVENADFEGILVTNASNVTVRGNRVLHNDQNLSISTTTCVDQASFETDEGFDCGEGIHLSGVDHSVVADNVVENNAGGILLSDDTGKTYDNLVTGNLSENNPYDCGIVLASHAPAPGSSAPHYGVVDNTIANNRSIHNGYQVPGAGAGVGLFADGTGPGIISGNIVIGNVLKDNGLPGVAFHSHVGPTFGLPADNLSDNVIVGNHISGNGADLFDTATPGKTGINVNSGGGGSPITGTVIAGNVFQGEDVAIAVNTPTEVVAHLNSFLDQGVGVDNLASGTVNATENWWGCAHGPGAPGCASVNGSGVLFEPWLTQPATQNGQQGDD